MKKNVQESLLHTMVRCMKYSTIILVIICSTTMSVLAFNANGQDVLNERITVSFKDIPLVKALGKITDASGVNFTYNASAIKSELKLTASVKDVTLKSLLDQLLHDQPYSYSVVDGEIEIRYEPKNVKAFGEKKAEVQQLKIITIHGKVTDKEGTPLIGATVKIKGENRGTATDNNGDYELENVPADATLIISYIGLAPQEVSVQGRTNIVVKLLAANDKLDEIQIIGYGTTTQRLSTGAIGTISSKEIEEQPVTNVLSSLSGRIAGVFVQTTNGLPGGNINIQIRGTGSITAGIAPLYIIDGIPFGSTIGGSFTTATGLLGEGSVNGAVSPFNSLNPDDIESITILKDADATSIYGSRGTNGVVIITTKKGKSGKTKVDINISQGVEEAADMPQMLNLQQYLQIRREAFANDGLTPSSDPTSSNYAPDLTVWNNGQSTNWTKWLLGGTGHVTDAQATITGGSEGTNFTLGGNFHSETTYLPGNNLYQRGGLHFSLQHTSVDHKFYVQFSNSLVLDNNRLANLTDDETDLSIPPNYPIYSSPGVYNWFYANPVAESNAVSEANTMNTVDNILMQYTLLPGLKIKASAGYTDIILDQTQIYPSVALYPGSTNYTNFGNNSTRTFIIEPQIDYDHQFKSSSIDILLGGTYQNTLAKGDQITANGFSSESLMNNLASASTYSLLNSYTEYKYESIFGRATYNFDKKYIINATIRRDGSSRFGPGNQFGTFGSVGAAWLFSDENFVKDNFSFLSFGKLRGSYGTTGNDQIADYQYLSTYGNSGYTYQSISGLKPSRIANADFHWETTRKFDAGLELGVLKDRILLNVDYYQNRSSDQLVNYKIPDLTGFATYQANLPADVQNKGWEFQVTSKNIQGKNFSWSTTFNLTIPTNTLLSFQNFSASSYANTLALGYDITRIYGYKFLGINSTTGLASYAPQAGSTSTSPYFYNTIGKKTPDLYGGFGNTFTFKNWQLDIFGQFANQMAVGGILYTPGQMINNYAIVLNRWQTAGDKTDIPKASTIADYDYAGSSANYFNASYFRVKNISLSYVFHGTWLSDLKINSLRLYFKSQNMFAFWNKNAPLLDPESGALAGSPNLPPVKTFTTGLQFIL